MRLVALFEEQGKGASARCVVVSLDAHSSIFNAPKLLVEESEVCDGVLVRLEEKRTLSIASLHFISIFLEPQLLSGAIVGLKFVPMNIVRIFDAPGLVVGFEDAILWLFDGVRI